MPTKRQTFVGLLELLVLAVPALGQPVIVVQPQDQNVLEGAGATFSVQASGAAPLRYQWLQYTNSTAHGPLPRETNSVLHISNAPLTSLRFAVAVANDQGAVTSRLARLTLSLRFVAHPTNQTVEQGLTATFLAGVTGTVQYSSQWYFTHAPMPGDIHTTLTLPDVMPADAGPYYCVFATAQGSITSQVATLTVLPNTNALPRTLPSFVNFETAPVNPVALSPDLSTLVVCNLPDARLEVFDVTGVAPRSVGNVPVGLDPVSVRFRTSNEVWVVNQVSDSVNIVDLAKLQVLATIPTLDAPADVVFAGEPERAFVSCAMENAVLVFDPLTRQRVATVPIDGDRPKALCTSPDGRKVYVAIFESGNASTILAPAFGLKSALPLPGVLEATNGPYGGVNPPPNRGTGFSPPINPQLGSMEIPRLGHIVKKNPAGRWMDDNNGDWTEFVSGAQAEVSGRVTGWDIPDRDLAIIDAATLAVQYATGLMNLCMAVAVNPANNEVTVVGTDGLNEIRFEPNLNGIFLRVNLARYHPVTGQKTVTDLNPHLDYLTRTLPHSERQKSVGDPRAILWNTSGTMAFVTGMGSGNLIAVTAAGNRSKPALQLEDGACGLALDENRNRLYVLNRFAATISVVDVEQWRVAQSVSLFDPTPLAIKQGRKHFYDTHKTSGLGHISCASCHPDGRLDRLAWDLGDPAGSIIAFSPFQFHPMKGPMVTMTLQDIIGHEPLHWRGDRRSIEEFNPTFRDLQAAELLTSNEMREFKMFLSTLTFPPNRYRNFDNSLSTNVPLPGHMASGQNQLPAGAPLPPGNALRGRDEFAGPSRFNCIVCHRLQTGHGFDSAQVPGPNGERRINSDSLARNNFLSFKDVQIRSVLDKVGMNLRSTASRSGFGFGFNGRVDTLTRFMDHGFPVLGDQTTADMVAFLLSFVGSDISTEGLSNGLEKDLPSNDVPASVGRQTTLTSTQASSAVLDQLLYVANLRRGRAELIIQGRHRTWRYDRVARRCQSDRESETATLDELRALASDQSPMTFLLIPLGTAPRAVDTDQDGFYDRDELDFGADPRNPFSIPLRGRLSLNADLLLSWNSRSGQTYRIQFNDALGSNWISLPEHIFATGTNTTVNLPPPSQPHRFYRIQAGE